MDTTNTQNCVDIISARGQQYFETTYGRVFDYYLLGEITSPTNYADWFNQIRNTTENDVIRMHINSPGGDLYTAIQFVHTLADANAKIEMHVEGACMSAATMIFMLGDEYYISPYSVFMFHNYSGGIIGKGNEIINQALNDRKWTSNIFSTMYKDFLSPTEINDLLNDKDIYMYQDDVIQRLTAKNEKRFAEAQTAQQSQERAVNKKKTSRGKK